MSVSMSFNSFETERISGEIVGVGKNGAEVGVGEGLGRGKEIEMEEFRCLDKK